jgi:hypothetical protein
VLRKRSVDGNPTDARGRVEGHDGRGGGGEGGDKDGEVTRANVDKEDMTRGVIKRRAVARKVGLGHCGRGMGSGWGGWKSTSDAGVNGDDLIEASDGGHVLHGANLAGGHGGWDGDGDTLNGVGASRLAEGAQKESSDCLGTHLSGCAIIFKLVDEKLEGNPAPRRQWIARRRGGRRGRFVGGGSEFPGRQRGRQHMRTEFALTSGSRGHQEGRVVRAKLQPI